MFLHRNNLRNAPKVVFQAELEKLERELKKLNDQIAATSDKEEKSKLIKRLNEVEKQHHVTDSADVWAREPPQVCILAPSREHPLDSDSAFLFALLVACCGPEIAIKVKDNRTPLQGSRRLRISWIFGVFPSRKYFKVRFLVGVGKITANRAQFKMHCKRLNI